MSSPAYQPLIFRVSVTSTVTVPSWSSNIRVGSILLQNLITSANSAFINWGISQAAPVANAAADSWELAPGQSLNLCNESISKLQLICASGETATVQYVIYPSTGGRGS